MKREEAIYELKNAAWLGTDHSRARTEEAVQMAIQALEQVDEIQEALDAYDNCEAYLGFREFPTNDLIGCIRRIVK